MCRSTAVRSGLVIGHDHVEKRMHGDEVDVTQVVGVDKADAVEHHAIEPRDLDEVFVGSRKRPNTGHDGADELVEQLGVGVIAVGLTDDGLDALFARRDRQVDVREAELGLFEGIDGLVHGLVGDGEGVGILGLTNSSGDVKVGNSHGQGLPCSPR